MSSAPNYNPETSFADDETNNVAGRSLVKTDSLDSELANISTSINGLNANLQAIQRDDNKLQDSVVEPYALAEQTRALIATSGSNPRGVWAPNTDYKFKDVIQRSNVAQMALQDHNSGSVFTQSFWLPISGDGTSAANAAAAAASASSAATSASSATASASSATASASAASTSASSAATSATNALNSAASAITSASNAANSADEAIAAAESITTPISSANDPTFASTSSNDAASPDWVNGKLSGIIFDWPGPSAPPGAMALPLVPTNVSRTTYSRWFTRFGTQWGVGDGSTTMGMPYCPENFVTIQANGNVGSQSTGQMPSHSHTVSIYGGAGGGAGLIAVATGSTLSGSANTNSVGTGSNNLAAGVRMLKCIWL